MSRIFATFLSILVVALAQVGKSIQTVTEININQYFGTWYEVYANPATLNTFPSGSYCTTTTYGPNADGTISVHNFQRNISPAGKSSDFYGYAHTSDPTKPGEFDVHYDSLGQEGSYWILKLGPVVNGLYDWALVSDKYSYTFHILTRDVSRFYTHYEKDLLTTATGMGFTPVPIYQGIDCVYTSDTIPPLESLPGDGVTTIMASEFPTMEPTEASTLMEIEPTTSEDEDEYYSEKETNDDETESISS